MGRTILVLLGDSAGGLGSRADGLHSQLQGTCRSNFPNQMLRMVFREVCKHVFARSCKRLLSKVTRALRWITQQRREAGGCP